MNCDEKPMSMARVDLVAFVLLSLLALVVFLQYGILQQPIVLDPGYFTYMGQQILQGHAPYESAFDHKTPLASFLTAFAILLGQRASMPDIISARYAFLIIAVLCVGFTYLVSRTAFRDRLVGLFAALIMLSFSSFGIFAVSGTEPKILMILLGLISIHAIQHRMWWLGGLAAALSFLTWQGGAFFMALALYFPARQTGRDRPRHLLLALLGMLIPFGALGAYFYSHRALLEAFRQAILFNFGYMRDMAPTSPLEHLRHLRGVALYGFGTESWFFVFGLLGWTLWVGRNALSPRVILRRTCLDGQTSPFLLSWYALVLLSLTNFQGVPDCVPLLPYVAAWAGYLIACGVRHSGRLMEKVRGGRLTHRGELWVCLVTACLVLLYGTTDAFAYDAPVLTLADQRILVADLVRCLSPDEGILVIGAPEILVLSGRTNALRYLYFYNNVDAYAARYEPAGFAGLIESLDRDKPAVIVYARRRATSYQNSLFQWFERNYDTYRLTIPVGSASLCHTCVQKLTMVVLRLNGSSCEFRFPVGACIQP